MRGNNTRKSIRIRGKGALPENNTQALLPTPYVPHPPWRKVNCRHSFQHEVLFGICDDLSSRVGILLRPVWLLVCTQNIPVLRRYPHMAMPPSLSSALGCSGENGFNHIAWAPAVAPAGEEEALGPIPAAGLLLRSASVYQAGLRLSSAARRACSRAVAQSCRYYR